jgi:aminoglycoside phosphotransferase (APT) family kinase protein
MSDAAGTADLRGAIRAYLSDRLGRDVDLSGFVRIAVGWSHETYLFDVDDVGYCVRRDPGNALLRDLSTLRMQFDVLRALDGTDVPSPKPYWYEDDPAVLGAPFIVMEKVPGECPNPWGREGRAWYEAAAGRGVLPESFTDALVALHRLDWRATGLGDVLDVPGAGNDFAVREVRKWRAFVDGIVAAGEHEPEPMMTELFCWLEANAPVTERLCFVHGAYRTGNLLIHEDRVSAVLDWELQVLGDPLYDVAYVLSDLNREGSDLLSYVVERDWFVDRYERATGITVDLDVCRYYEVLYAMRSAAFWMSASGLFASGRNPDLRLARTAYSVPVVLDMAARQLGF